MAKLLMEVDDIKEEDMEKLDSIRAVDKSFVWKVVCPKRGKLAGHKILIVRCESLDQAYQRGEWLRHKFFGDGRLYWVKP